MEWIFLIGANVFVALRIYTHLFYLRKRLGWSEWLLIAAALDALGLMICDTMTFKMGVLDDYSTSVKLSKVHGPFQLDHKHLSRPDGSSCLVYH